MNLPRDPWLLVPPLGAGALTLYAGTDGPLGHTLTVSIVTTALVAILVVLLVTVFQYIDRQPPVSSFETAVATAASYIYAAWNIGGILPNPPGTTPGYAIVSLVYAGIVIAVLILGRYAINALDLNAS